MTGPRRARLAALAAVACVVLGAGPARAGHHEAYEYVAGPGDLTVVNCDGSFKVTATGVGGTCFDVLRGETQVSISADDATGTPISLTYAFSDAAGDVVGGYQQVCGGTVTAIPAGAQRLTVYVDTALAATGPCIDVGTTGTLSATFA